MIYLFKNIICILLILVAFSSCAVLKGKDKYVYCSVQNVENVVTGDKKIDRKRKRKKLKFTDNRKAFLYFYADFFEELEKENIKEAKILQHFEEVCSINYNGVSLDTSAAFIKYMHYLNSYTTDDDYLLETVQCGGKNKFKVFLTCKPKKKAVTWWFSYSKNHKIKSFKETIEVYEP